MTNATNTTLSLGRQSTSRNRKGFSLVELMCVLAVMSLIAASAWPSIVGIVSGDRLSNNAYELGGLIQQARTTAITQHTYVWVGFYSFTKDGAAAVEVATVAGNNCLPTLPTDVATGLTNGSYQLAAKSIILKNVTLAANNDYAGTTSPLPGVDAADNTDASTQSYFFTMKVLGNSSAKFTNLIAFGPDGQAFLPATSTGALSSPALCVGIGFNAAPGSPSHLKTVAVQIHGLSGQVSVFQQ